jgi:hypothetical protein
MTWTRGRALALGLGLYLCLGTAAPGAASEPAAPRPDLRRRAARLAGAWALYFIESDGGRSHAGVWKPALDATLGEGLGGLRSGAPAQSIEPLVLRTRL